MAIANAGYRYSSDGRCVYLTGAETVEQFRGRGVYKTLIAHRAARAVERGCVLASILAGENALGLIGMVIAVPLVTVVKEAARLLLEHRKNLARPHLPDTEKPTGLPHYVC